jgi:hypothetical protein
VSDLKKRVEKHLGEGYYDFILKMGVIAGIPQKRLARELETTVVNVEQIKRDYATELQDLKIHSMICDQVFGDLSRVTMTQMLMKILERLNSGIDDLDSKEMIDAMKFIAKHLSDTQKVSAKKEQASDIPTAEIRERALRVLKNE